MSELELKFQVPLGAREALLEDLRSGPGPAAEPLRLQASYFDTPDALLGRHRMALRLRREGDRWTQTLKAARPHSVDRLEENVDRGPAGDEGPTASAPALDLEAHATGEAGRLLHALLDRHPQARLGARYTTDVRRLRRVVQWGEATVEVALDEGEIVAGERRLPLHEIEFERLTGDVAALFHLAGRWQARHGLWLDVVSKAERGERLARGGDFGDPVKASAPRLDRRLDGPALRRAVIAACLSQVLPNLGAIAHGDHAPERVHQARVGLRRLRTALRELAALGPAIDAGCEPALSAAFHALGHDRDDTVLPAQFAPLLEAAGAPLCDWRDAGRPAAHAPAGAVVDPLLQRVLLALLALAEGAEEGGVDAAGAPGPKAARRALGRRLTKLHREVARDADHFDRLPADRQHRTRKRLKRLRYLAEFVAPLHGHRAVRRFLDALEPAQDALGHLLDEVVAAGRFRDRAAHDPRALFAVGWFEARHGQQVRAARRALRRVARAEPFWG